MESESEEGVVRLRLRKQRQSKKNKEQREAVEVTGGVKMRWLEGCGDVESCRDGMARERERIIGRNESCIWIMNYMMNDE